MKTNALGACLALFTAALVAAPATIHSAAAQTTQTSADAPVARGFWVTASHPDISIAPGETASFPLKLLNATDAPRRASLKVAGLPEGWTYTLKAGGTIVASAMVLPDETASLSLEVVPPEEAENKTYEFEVAADWATGSGTLPLTVSLADIPTGQTELKPKLPALRGTASSTFKYEMKLTNGGAEEALFNLAAEVPPGFSTTFKRGYGSEEITGVPVEAGASENITLEVRPNNTVPAGDYPVNVSAVAGSQSASAELKMTVTGTPSLRLVGPQQRLSGTAVAGQETTFPFTVRNSGSAPAKQVELKATAPSGWEVTFEPAEFPELAAGAEEEVTVRMRPTEKAIAGDYMVTLRGQADGISESTDFRVTVGTSTMWGIAGVGIIGAAALVLVGAVFRYGRR